jgi:dihydrolipoamide dehydrogenase
VSDPVEVRVPDIGDFADVPIIEVLVEPGATVEVEDPLVTLESDKATMDVPSPMAGTVRELQVELGDKVSEGTVLLVLEPAQQDGASSNGAGAPAAQEEAESAPAETQSEPAEPERSAPPEADIQAEVVVLGSGPGGYTAAFRAADLGLKTVLVERHERLGGVCLNVGCIPSKALLHIARVIAEGEEAAGQGVKFGEPEIDLDGVRAFKDAAVKRLTGGLGQLSKQRKIEIVKGEATFTGPNVLTVGDTTIGFEHAIIACGSSAIRPPGFPDDPRIMDSTGALALEDVPERLLVVGGGIIGLEMATVYDALGSKVTVVEMLPQLIHGCDPDVVRPLAKRIKGRYEAIHLETKVESVEATDDGLVAKFGDQEQTFDRILLAVGRKPNGGGIGADAAGVQVDDRGFIRVDEQMRTNVPHIFAIGDVVGEPMLAHKATHEGKVAAEVIAGHDVAFDPRAIPSVAYTDPEVAWMGLTEVAAKEQGVEYEKAVFPWAASGRALTIGREEGFAKVLTEPGTGRVIGAGIVGVNAGELIAETVLAFEMGADAEDVGLTIHPHPTLSESLGMAAEVAAGTVTDIMPPRRR